VKVDAAGQPAWRTLRDQLAPGARRSLQATVTRHRHDPDSSTDSAFDLDETVSVASVDDAGQAALTVAVDRASGAGSDLAAGIELGARVGADGRVDPAPADHPAGEVAALERSILLLHAVQLPETPIGPGARWRYRVPFDGGVMQASAELLDLDGDRAFVRLAIRVRGTTDDAQIDGSGQGELTIDLAQPPPYPGTIETTLHTTTAGRDELLRQITTISAR
jgi:hypothetical protein